MLFLSAKNLTFHKIGKLQYHEYWVEFLLLPKEMTPKNEGQKFILMDQNTKFATQTALYTSIRLRRNLSHLLWL